MNLPKELAHHRSFYEEILNMIPAEIIVADTQYRYLFVNPSAVPDAHLREWMIGKTNEEFCQYAGRPERTARARRQAFLKVLRTKEMIEWGEEVRDENGHFQHYLQKVYPVLNAEGDVQWVIIYGITITERKEFEEKIRRSEKRYRDLFNYSQALICTHDMSGRLLAINPEICRVLGYAEGEMISRRIQDFIPAEHQSKFREEYLDVIRTSSSAVSGV
ncbi:MAG TPA: PAS domain S-box protein, partial [Puia sp.]